jgi:peptide/nickel transport system substrate-binding protein
MPARVAATSENEQIKEFVGSGPFKFVKDEWQPGYQVVYVRNPDYVPRSDAPSGSAGAKRASVEKVVWRYIPDAATAAAALAAGEVDWWENPPLDFVPKVEADPALTTFVQDPRGTQGWIRPNHLHPPFNNTKARQALLSMVDQRQYLQATIGQAKYYRTCAALFTCGGPWESSAGAPRQDLAKAAQLVKESGYDGRPVVLLDPADIPLTHGAALVTRDLMTRIGFNVDLQAMDWSTVVARRAKKDPPAQGGWNVLFTWWIASDVINPAVHAGISGAGASAWFGWPENAEIEKLKLEWVRATDHARQKRLADEIQKLAYEEVPYVPFGQWVTPTAYRRSVKGILPFPAPLFWNVSIT